MKSLKKAAAAVLAALTISAALAGCNQSAPSAVVDDGTKVFSVGVCQFAAHAALDDAAKGFKQALSDKLGSRVSFIDKVAGADASACVTACEDFAAQNVDLIFANGTTALQAAYAATDKTPIIAANVTDYAAALDFDGTINITGMNVSGTTCLVPPSDQAGMLHELFPEAESVGVLYCSDELGAQVQAAAITPLLTDFGYEVKDFTFSGEADLEDTVKSACKASDVIYIPNDSIAALNAEAINAIVLEKEVPVVVPDSGMLTSCGTVGLVPDAYALGYKAGEMAFDVLSNGADITSMKIKEPDSLTKKYVPDRCEALELDVPDSYTKAE